MYIFFVEREFVIQYWEQITDKKAKNVLVLMAKAWKGMSNPARKGNPVFSLRYFQMVGRLIFQRLAWIP